MPKIGARRRCGRPKERWSPALHLRLPSSLSARVLGGDLGVGGRVPHPLVDPVHHADQSVAEPEEEVVQTESAAGGTELLGLRRAHGGHHVGEGQTALEEVDLAVPLELLPVVQLPGETDLRHDLGPEVTLIARIVHRHHAGCGPRVALVRERGPEVHRRERRVPVVGVQHDRPLHQARQRQAGGQREEGEPSVVVGVVGAALAVDAVAVEVLAVVDEIDLRPGRGPAGAEHPRLLVPAAEAHHERLADGLEVGVLVAHGAVEGEDGGDVEAGGVLEVGQPRHRLGQSAGAGVGEVLRGHVNDGDGLPASRARQLRHRVRLSRWADRRPPSRP